MKHLNLVNCALSVSRGGRICVMKAREIKACLYLLCSAIDL
jgi:hypothetical protein